MLVRVRWRTIGVDLVDLGYSCIVSFAFRLS